MNKFHLQLSIAVEGFTLYNYLKQANKSKIETIVIEPMPNSEVGKDTKINSISISPLDKLIHIANIWNPADFIPRHKDCIYKLSIWKKEYFMHDLSTLLQLAQERRPSLLTSRLLVAHILDTLRESEKISLLDCLFIHRNVHSPWKVLFEMKNLNRLLENFVLNAWTMEPLLLKLYEIITSNTNCFSRLDPVAEKALSNLMVALVHKNLDDQVRFIFTQCLSDGITFTLIEDLVRRTDVSQDFDRLIALTGPLFGEKQLILAKLLLEKNIPEYANTIIYDYLSNREMISDNQEMFGNLYYYLVEWYASTGNHPAVKKFALLAEKFGMDLLPYYLVLIKCAAMSQFLVKTQRLDVKDAVRIMKNRKQLPLDENSIPFIMETNIQLHRLQSVEKSYRDWIDKGHKPTIDMVFLIYYSIWLSALKVFRKSPAIPYNKISLNSDSTRDIISIDLTHNSKAFRVRNDQDLCYDTKLISKRSFGLQFKLMRMLYKDMTDFGLQQGRDDIFALKFQIDMLLGNRIAYKRAIAFVGDKFKGNNPDLMKNLLMASLSSHVDADPVHVWVRGLDIWTMDEAICMRDYGRKWKDNQILDIINLWTHENLLIFD
jgi:hypothetical protein